MFKKSVSNYKEQEREREREREWYVMLGSLWPLRTLENPQGDLGRSSN